MGAPHRKFKPGKKGKEAEDPVKKPFKQQDAFERKQAAIFAPSKLEKKSAKDQEQRVAAKSKRLGKPLDKDGKPIKRQKSDGKSFKERQLGKSTKGGESDGRKDSTADVVVEINKLWEKLRSKSVEKDATADLSEQVFALVKGRVKEMALKHDASRALQAVFTKGTEEQRAVLLGELKVSTQHSEQLQSHKGLGLTPCDRPPYLQGNLRDLCMSKYGRQVILKFLREAKKPMLAPIFYELRGFTRKLLTHKVARAVIDCMYGEVGRFPTRSLSALYADTYVVTVRPARRWARRISVP